MKVIAVSVFLAVVAFNAAAQTKPVPPQYKAPAAEPVPESRTLENAPEGPELPRTGRRCLWNIMKRSRPIACDFMFSGCGRETTCWARYALT